MGACVLWASLTDSSVQKADLGVSVVEQSSAAATLYMLRDNATSASMHSTSMKVYNKSKKKCISMPRGKL